MRSSARSSANILISASGTLEEEELEEEPDDNGDSIPDFLKHLPVEQHNLMKDIVELILANPKVVERGWVQGAAHLGLPYDPSKPTTCCYIVQGLDVSKFDLGGLPRDEIYQEMEGNPSKLAKQRRDVSFPDGETDSQLQQQFEVDCFYLFRLELLC